MRAVTSQAAQTCAPSPATNDATAPRTGVPRPGPASQGRLRPAQPPPSSGPDELDRIAETMPKAVHGPAQQLRSSLSGAPSGVGHPTGLARRSAGVRAWPISAATHAAWACCCRPAVDLLDRKSVV